MKHGKKAAIRPRGRQNQPRRDRLVRFCVLPQSPGRKGSINYMKTVSMMQPFYLPWKGLFDMIHQSDVFVFYDDV